ncbi:hypothetical protein shn_09750 [Shinella sp. HZN7]|nr:hypothetical protein shn_09750 [Shinella sp. HZN7]
MRNAAFGPRFARNCRAFRELISVDKCQSVVTSRISYVWAGGSFSRSTVKSMPMRDGKDEMSSGRLIFVNRIFASFVSRTAK